MPCQTHVPDYVGAFCSYNYRFVRSSVASRPALPLAFIASCFWVFFSPLSLGFCRSVAFPSPWLRVPPGFARFRFPCVWPALLHASVLSRLFGRPLWGFHPLAFRPLLPRPSLLCRLGCLRFSLLLPARRWGGLPASLAPLQLSCSAFLSRVSLVLALPAGRILRVRSLICPFDKNATRPLCGALFPPRGFVGLALVV